MTEWEVFAFALLTAVATGLGALPFLEPAHQDGGHVSDPTTGEKGEGRRPRAAALLLLAAALPGMAEAQPAHGGATTGRTGRDRPAADVPGG